MSDAYSFVKGLNGGAPGAPSPNAPPTQDPSAPPPASSQLPQPQDPSKMRLPPGAAAALEQMPTVSMTLRRLKEEDCIKVMSLPPEEFLISRDATDEDDALFIGHRRKLRVSDLVAMGYDYEDMLAAVSADIENQEAAQRNPALSNDPRDDNLDPSMRKVVYVEGAMRIDLDGDGIAERVKVCCVGDTHRVVNVEPAPDVNYAVFSPNPQPHTAVGNSIADETMDLQKIKSQLMRFTLDGLAQSIVPRTAYDQNTVNADDIVSNEVGAHIRVKGAPGNAIFPIVTQFPVNEALGALGYMDQVRDSRTGISKASQGLDIDALQNQTATAVNATMSAAEMRQEVIARFFGETLKRCFRGLLKLIHRHQDQPRMVRLRNKFVQIDPRAWNVDMDVTVNVAIGTARREEKIAAFAAIAAKQEQILLKLGPDNAICDIGQLRNSYAKMLELVGEKDIASYFKEVRPEDIQQAAQNAQNDPNQAQNDAAVKIAEAETIKAQADMLTAQQKPMLDKQKLDQEQDFKRDELESQVIIKGTEIALKYGVNPAEMIELIFAAMARQRQSQPMPVVPSGLDIGGPPGGSPHPPPGGPPMGGNGAMPPGMGMP